MSKISNKLKILFSLIIIVLIPHWISVDAAGVVTQELVYKIEKVSMKDGYLYAYGYAYNTGTINDKIQDHNEWRNNQFRLYGDDGSIISSVYFQEGGFHSHNDPSAPSAGVYGFEVGFNLNGPGFKAGVSYTLQIKNTTLRGDWRNANVSNIDSSVTSFNRPSDQLPITLNRGGTTLVLKVGKKNTGSGTSGSSGSGSGSGSSGGSSGSSSGTGGSGGSSGITSGGGGEAPTPSEPKNCAPDSKILTFYYSYLGGWKADGTNWKTPGAKNNEASTSTFPDTKIIQSVFGVSSNNELSTNDMPYLITNKSQIDWFYTNYYKTLNSNTHYTQDGDKYFITYDSWCTGSGECYDAESGCLISGGSSKSGSNNCPYKRKKSVPQGAFENGVIAMGTNPSGGDNVVTKLLKKSDFGFDMKITRHMSGTNKSMINPSQEATPVEVNEGYGTQYIHPAVHILTVCKKGDGEEDDCKDEVNQAVCDASDAGTEAIFHEDSRLKTCTLKSGNQSGFTILEKDETTNPAGKSYCEAACKDDIDIFLPGHKQTAAGQYFILDKYTPQIKAKRTCVSSEIKYDEFINDLKPLEEELVKKYNEWQDLKYIEENAEKEPAVTETTDDCCHKEPERCPKDEPDCYQECKQSVKHEWTRPAFTNTPNGLKKLEEREGEWTTGHDERGSDERSSSWQEDVVQPRQEAENAYKSALEEYSETINAYTKCFEWIEDNVPNTKVSGTTISKGSASGVFAEFKFKPSVFFTYGDPEDQDSPVLGRPFQAETIDKTELSTSKSYWAKGASVNEDYSGGSGGANKENRGYLKCDGTTCRKNDLDTSLYFYTNSHMKREEKIEYTYHLPTIYTTVPDGKVHQGNRPRDDEETITIDGKTAIRLPDDSVPVNINTPAKTHPYTITIDGVMDETRLKMKDSKPTVNGNDNFDDRFAGDGEGGMVLTEGNDYICNYDVINDIYIPGERLNFFYRIIDPLEINPLGRTLGYNWSDDRGNTVREAIKTPEQDYQLFEGKDKFEFTLTPLIMKQVRKYNAEQSRTTGGPTANGYSDWDLKCYDYNSNSGGKGYHCYSQFLSCFASGGESGESGISVSCNEIFGNTLSGYKNRFYASEKEYDYNDLRDNRNKLIDKQNALDNKGGY